MQCLWRAICRKVTIIDMHLKLKRTPGLYLVGFMASGKTTIGAHLARYLGWDFVDVDSEIERSENRTIASIFAEDGEAAFRDRETAAIRRYIDQVQTGHPRVIALGGGAFIQERNFELLKDNGITVWLDCPLDVVNRRLGEDSTRPLARDREKLARLYEDRLPLYSRADFRVPVDTEDAAAVVTRIAALPIF
jgi:shikimate kinase